MLRLFGISDGVNVTFLGSRNGVVFILLYVLDLIVMGVSSFVGKFEDSLIYPPSTMRLYSQETTSLAIDFPPRSRDESIASLSMNCVSIDGERNDGGENTSSSTSHFCVSDQMKGSVRVREFKI